MAIELKIVTPEGEVFAGNVHSVVLPGLDGELEVLESHERYLVQLQPGVVAIKDGSKALFAALSGGFVNITGSKVTVLADTCELAEEIDLARAERARDRAKAAMEKAQAGTDLFAEEQVALQRAATRIVVAARR